MKTLVSVISLKEAQMAIEGNPDILDIKNPKEGSLGAQFPWVLKEIRNELNGTNIIPSATLGDLPYKPGTASLAAFGASECGMGYIKAGLYGVRNYKEACDIMDSIVRSVKLVNNNILTVAAGYADYKRFGGLAYHDLVKAAKYSKADVVMVDTAIKDGRNLFDFLSHSQLKEFIDSAHEEGLEVALAGSIRKEHLDVLVSLNPDIIGIRGAVCQNGDRTTGIIPEKIKEFMSHLSGVHQIYH